MDFFVLGRSFSKAVKKDWPWRNPSCWTVIGSWQLNFPNQLGCFGHCQSQQICGIPQCAMRSILLNSLYHPIDLYQLTEIHQLERTKNALLLEYQNAEIDPRLEKMSPKSSCSKTSLIKYNEKCDRAYYKCNKNIYSFALLCPPFL